ncbi:MAG TPA: hypothetical protein VF384_03025 [Planctomycetota bacterium]
MIERLRGTPLSDVYSQHTANPVLTVQGRRVTVAFPQAILNQTFSTTIDRPAAKVAGFLPVRLTVQSGAVTLVLNTLVGPS